MVRNLAKLLKCPSTQTDNKGKEIEENILTFQS